MSLTPVSRESMREYRAKNLEEARIKLEEAHKKRINNIVTEIYNGAINTANKTDDSRYLYKLPHAVNTPPPLVVYGKLYSQSHNEVPIDFYRTNLVEIINGVQMLFPDSSVKHTTITMVGVRDGKLYDISKIDENIVPGVTKPIPCITRAAAVEDYIVVDWT